MVCLWLSSTPYWMGWGREAEGFDRLQGFHVFHALGDETQIQLMFLFRCARQSRSSRDLLDWQSQGLHKCVHDNKHAVNLPFVDFATISSRRPSSVYTSTPGTRIRTGPSFNPLPTYTLASGPTSMSCGWEHVTQIFSVKLYVTTMANREFIVQQTMSEMFHGSVRHVAILPVCRCASRCTTRFG